MARHKDDPEPKEALRCPGCRHRDPHMRFIHWLKLPDDDRLAGHLLSELGEEFKATGGISAVIRRVRTVRGLYGDTVDAEGQPLPLWKAYLDAHGRLPLDHRQRDQRAKQTRERELL